MMRKINLFFILPVMILLLCSTRSMAQGQDANYKWVGNELSTVIGNSNADMNAVYLYNVGTGKYLNVGSIWGTSWYETKFNVDFSRYISHRRRPRNGRWTHVGIPTCKSWR